MRRLLRLAPVAPQQTTVHDQLSAIGMKISKFPKKLCGCLLLGCALLLLLAPTAVSASEAREKFFEADRHYNRLKKNARLQQYRDKWLACIERYQDVYRHDPDGPWAAAGMFRSGELYYELYQRSFKLADRLEAVDIFQRIIKRYPRSRYRARSEKALAAVTAAADVQAPATASPAVEEPEDDLSDIITEAETIAPRTPPAGEKGSTGPVVVKDIRYWSNPNYTRVVIDADRETDFVHNLLNKDPSHKKPQRLYVDLAGSRLAGDIENNLPIHDNLLRSVRAGQHRADEVRVVVDIKSFKSYKVFSLRHPFRIVIDVWGVPTDTSLQAEASAKTSAPGGQKPGPGALARQLALGVSRIVVDAGHGGRDYGAPGYFNRVHEKYIVLSIARRLARKIKNTLNCEVIMTRSSDTYLTLEERTAIANTRNADLFISIHTNSAPTHHAYGIETYFLNLATDDEAILVAARENATSARNISDLQAILTDLMQNAKINESSRLAAHVQTAINTRLKPHYSHIKDKGVKQAPFYVLLGAQMPAILIETSFISNPRECRRLLNKTYQDRLCEGIVKGIRDYIQETSPTAFSAPSSVDRDQG